MHTFVAFIVTYIIGGLTFIPLVLALILVHAHLTFPHHGADSTTEAPRPSSDSLRHPSDDTKTLLSGPDALGKKFLGEREKDVAEGYFAVCREYVPGGVNGKPPVRATPSGEVVAGESPSVYQTMYRSLFERRQTLSTIDAGKGDAAKTARRARNIFYVVLRHGHLMLYDDAEQVEVRHVISLAYHDVSIYGGGNEIPEGELWIKRNAIRLSRKVASGDTSSASLPFYFFSENCSDKEDFYFALLQNQERDGRDIQPPPQVENFEVKHIISLVQKLHSSEEQLQTRWLNALVGRLFLAVYKTQEIEDFIRTKITKKITRVKKPGFISGIQLKKISLGESAPLVTNPRLKDLTIDGTTCVEADVQYNGMFRIELATTVKIDLGTRFKTREVDLVLAAVVKKLEGHLLVRMKPAPSNRLWIAFEKMPRLELSIEPIVSSRQITYGIILRAIESRIREVIQETIVLPQWDDTPFLNTTGYRFRGGIWAREEDDSQQDVSTAVPNDESENEVEGTISVTGSPHTLPTTGDEKSISMPSLVSDSNPAVKSRKTHRPSRSEVSNVASTLGAQKRPTSPTAVRSKSFASTAVPVLNKDIVTSDIRRSDTSSTTPKNATALMTELSNRSQPSSPFDSPVGSFNSRRASLTGPKDSASISSKSSRNSVSEDLSASQDTITESTRSLAAPSLKDLDGNPDDVRSTNGTPPASKLQSMAKTMTPSERKQQAFLHAAAAAKTWGWNTLSRKGKSSSSSTTPERAGTPEHPIGRGRPLPPPGMPLPPPAKRDSVTTLNVAKRRPVPPPPLPERNKSTSQGKPGLPPRVPRSRSISKDKQSKNEDILVVTAPEEEDNAAGESDDHDGYGEFMDNVMVDEDAEKEPSLGAEETFVEPPDEEAMKTALPKPAGRPASARSYSDDDHGLASWRSAEEQEARSKSIWMDEKEQ